MENEFLLGPRNFLVRRPISGPLLGARADVVGLDIRVEAKAKGTCNLVLGPGWGQKILMYQQWEFRPGLMLAFLARSPSKQRVLVVSLIDDVNSGPVNYLIRLVLHFMI